MRVHGPELGPRQHGPLVEHRYESAVAQRYMHEEAWRNDDAEPRNRELAQHVARVARHRSFDRYSHLPARSFEHDSVGLTRLGKHERAMAREVSGPPESAVRAQVVGRPEDAEMQCGERSRDEVSVEGGGCPDREVETFVHEIDR